MPAIPAQYISRRPVSSASRPAALRAQCEFDPIDACWQTMDLRPDGVFARPLAQQLLQAELAAAASLLAGVYGQCGLFVRPCVSAPQQLPAHLIGDVRMLHVSSPDALSGDLRCEAAALPFASDSFQLIVVQHAAEVLRDAGPFLEEIGRVLAPEGVLLVLGFNPFSLWRLWAERATTNQVQGPRFMAVAQYRKALQQAEVETLQVRYLGSVWPHARWLGTEATSENHGIARLYFRLRATQMVMARKRRNGVTPLRWRETARDVALRPGLLGGTQRARLPVVMPKELVLPGHRVSVDLPRPATHAIEMGEA